MATPNIIPTIFTAVDRMTAPIRNITQSLRGLGAAGGVGSTQIANLERSMSRVSDRAMKIGNQLAPIGLAIVAPMGLAVNKAIEFEDKLVDVGKTTGLADKELETFGQSIMKMGNSTRTSIDDLLKIGEIGGQLGVAKNELLSFVQAGDEFGVALAKDYGGGIEQAITSVGKLGKLFKESRGMTWAESIKRAGSAINELGAQGAGTSMNINDFALRIGALPDAMKPSIQSTLALGTFFEEMGVNAEIGASGFSNFLLDASRNLPAFAAQMKITVNEANALLATDPAEFVKKFATSLNGLNTEQTAQLFKKLSLASNEEIKILGSLQSNTERYTELLAIANKEYDKGTSLTKEAAKKQQTAAAMMGRLKNITQSLGITIGTLLLPPLEKFGNILSWVVQGVTNFARNHKTLSGILVKSVAVVGALALGVAGVAYAVGFATKAWELWKNALLAYNFVCGFTATLTGTLNGELLLIPAAARGAAAGMAVLNGALTTTLIRLGAIGALIYTITKLYDKAQEGEARLSAVTQNLPKDVNKADFEKEMRREKTGVTKFLPSTFQAATQPNERYQKLFDSLSTKYYDEPKRRQDSTMDALTNPYNVQQTLPIVDTANKGTAMLMNGKQEHEFTLTVKNATDNEISANYSGSSATPVNIKVEKTFTS